ncbi:unnamed protein product [Heligmosomoides polygyrus]|uniref:ZP domain-containing protein n=1 Tax=Heligmosomoides polygyrus TaxID=6339 RepID=A0A183G5Z0_HELPZ|nr:unnamed protein product [Heligmosomoides polygyrus]
MHKLAILHEESRTFFYLLKISVDEVSCSSGSLTVMLNKSDPDIARWMNDPKSQPVVYVYGHKTLVPCGTSLKNDKGQQNYNLTIPYGKHCDVHLADLPNYRTAETTIALEDNVDTSISKIVRINHVFCLYTRSVQTIRYSDVSTAHEVLASTGGKPKPKVEMMFRSTDGRPLRTAKFGDTVEFYVALTPDKAYHGISPKECMFSDREDMLSPDARHLTFVQSRSVVTPVTVPDVGNHRSAGQQHGVRAVHRTSNVLDSLNCFKRISNSNLTAERLRFRHKRAVNPPFTKADVYDQVSVRESLTILDDVETEEGDDHFSSSINFWSSFADPLFSGRLLLVLSSLALLLVLGIPSWTSAARLPNLCARWTTSSALLILDTRWTTSSACLLNPYSRWTTSSVRLLNPCTL